MFVICVSCDETADTIRGEEPGPASTGWIVARQLDDFKNLHDKLKQVFSTISTDRVHDNLK